MGTPPARPAALRRRGPPSRPAPPRRAHGLPRRSSHL